MVKDVLDGDKNSLFNIKKSAIKQFLLFCDQKINKLNDS